MNIFIQILRTFFRFLVPFIFIVTFVLKTYFITDSQPLDYLYIVLLASMVGYFTNFIAIKMLFHPREKSLFGRQGMIPANKEKIAQKLGNNIADQFFLPSDISNYLLDQEIIQQMLDQWREAIHEKLSEPQTREQIRLWLYHLLGKNSDKIQTFFNRLADKDLAALFEKHVPIQTFLSYLTTQIEKSIDDGSIDLNEVTEWLAGILHEYTPQISQVLYEQFQGYMDQQSGLKKNTLKLIQWMSDFEPEKLKKILHQKFSSEDFRQETYKTVESWARRLVVYLQTEEGAQKVNQHYHHIIQHTYGWIQDKGMPLSLEKIKDSLNQPKSWQAIEDVVFFLLRFFEKESHYFVRSRTFKKLLSEGTCHIIHRMNISKMIRNKIKHFNTDELETLILNTSGDQLGTIEVLGGFLGAFTGIAIFNPYLFFWILIAILLVFLAEKILGQIFK